MPVPDIRSRLDLARSLAVQAGDRTLDRFHSGLARIEIKGDGSPVTDADRRAERFLRDAINSAFPADEVLGEEFGETPGSSGFRWVLDPIDGTASFIRGVPLYGTLIAIEHNHIPVAGVIHIPALTETVFASIGHGAWHSRAGSPPAPARVSAVPRLADSLILTTSLDYFTTVHAAETWLAIQSAARSTRGWSDCYAFLLVATGRAEASIEPAVHRWDVAAIAPIIHEAGGRYTDWTGESDVSQPMCLASNSLIHEELLKFTRERRTGQLAARPASRPACAENTRSGGH